MECLTNYALQHLKIHRFSYHRNVSGDEKNAFNKRLDEALSWCVENPKPDASAPPNPSKSKLSKREFKKLHRKDLKAKMSLKAAEISWKTQVESKIRKEEKQHHDAELRKAKKQVYTSLPSSSLLT